MLYMYTHIIALRLLFCRATDTNLEKASFLFAPSYAECVVASSRALINPTVETLCKL